MLSRSVSKSSGKSIGAGYGFLGDGNDAKDGGTQRFGSCEMALCSLAFALGLLNFGPTQSLRVSASACPPPASAAPGVYGGPGMLCSCAGRLRTTASKQTLARSQNERPCVRALDAWRSIGVTIKALGRAHGRGYNTRSTYPPLLRLNLNGATRPRYHLEVCSAFDGVYACTGFAIK